MKRASTRIALAVSGVAALTVRHARRRRRSTCRLHVAARPPRSRSSSTAATGTSTASTSSTVTSPRPATAGCGSSTTAWSTRRSRSTDDDSLIVNTVGGSDDKWSPSQVAQPDLLREHQVRHRPRAHRLGHGRAAPACGRRHPPRSTSSTSPARTPTATPATTAWCSPWSRSSTTQYIARAFFPSTPKRSRNVLVDDSIWTSGSWTPTNILGHELGHTLGFRHEHTRPESGTCFEDNNWRPLTPYDSASIMHYPQCNGSSDDLSFTSTDGNGVRALYGS